jgi:hypothetical protein
MPPRPALDLSVPSMPKPSSPCHEGLPRCSATRLPLLRAEKRVEDHLINPHGTAVPRVPRIPDFSGLDPMGVTQAQV